MAVMCIGIMTFVMHVLGNIFPNSVTYIILYVRVLDFLRTVVLHCL